MPERTSAFAARPTQDRLLRELNRLLARAELEAPAAERSIPERPMVFVIGAPRSGTTLMLQWLAASKRFAYPSNLMSRFFEAPYIGSRIQQLLTDPSLDYRGELQGAELAQFAWTSDVGKTRGLLQPHEFSYYWRRFFPIDQAQKLTAAQIAASDSAGFVAGWGSIERVFGKPVAAKGILLQYNVLQLAEWLPTSIFIHTRREPVHNIRSLLRARSRVHGTQTQWFSVQPPQFEWLQREDPYTQVAGQILFTNESIEHELAQLAPHRALSVEYEAFCRDPAAVWSRLERSFGAFGSRLEGGYGGPASFECTNPRVLSEDEQSQFRAAHARLAGLREGGQTVPGGVL